MAKRKSNPTDEETLAAMDSEPNRNPVLAYADSYRDMAKQGVESVPIWSVITDLERNIAPLYRHAPPAPAVPGKITPSQAQALCPSKYYVMNGDELNVAADFWNACRAAMLAQPVSQGKLVPVEVLATASTLIDLCRTYTILQDTGSYKERTINDCENTMEVIDGLLAAAPGYDIIEDYRAEMLKRAAFGGDGHDD